jgi:hypothetical protein
MIIDGIVVVERAQQHEVAAIAGTAVPEHELLQSLLVDQLL